jgi:hypothetical protein
MAGAKREKSGLIAKWRDKKRLKQERTGDTPEKKGERVENPYSAEDMANRAAGAGVMGGGGGTGGL